MFAQTANESDELMLEKHLTATEAFPRNKINT